MRRFIIYPAIDLRLGRVVRLQEGDPARQTTYSDDPARVAERWLESGAAWLHVVNLDGAFDQSDTANQEALRAILASCRSFNARVQFGGGIRTLGMVERLLDLGVSRVVLGTIAIEQPQLVADALKKSAEENMAVGIDARDGLVRVRGWQSNSGIHAIDLVLRMKALGVHTIVFTDISRDGLGSGLNIPSTRQLGEVSGLDVIASGGVHSVAEVIEARAADLAGVIIGRALYEGTIDLRTALESNIS
jgi:phosphoribosylformimino-5-aminoimidazole carboxamide ribotide isomerase